MFTIDALTALLSMVLIFFYLFIQGNKLLVFGGMNNNNYIGSSMFVVDLESQGKHHYSEFENIMRTIGGNKTHVKRSSVSDGYSPQRPISFSRHNNVLPPIK